MKAIETPIIGKGQPMYETTHSFRDAHVTIPAGSPSLRLGIILCLLVAAFSGTAFCAWDDAYDFPAKRDPYKWPFAGDSIWNTPIHRNAEYVHAHIPQATAFGMTEDEDIIIITPNAPMTKVMEHNASWNRARTRCESQTGKLLYQVPIPHDFSTDPGYSGATPNMGVAVLMPDGRTLKQSQPFHRCGVGGVAVTQYLWPDVDIYADGVIGAHGGSGMSTLGGALRIGEMMPGSPPIHHALKINLSGLNGSGYRWPAVHCDRGNPEVFDFNGINQKLEGALFALRSDVDIKAMGLETEPAKYLARAFQDYGAYLVDGTGWNVYALITEWGPDGRFIDEFEKTWGFPFREAKKDTPWARDMDRLFANLHVIQNSRKGFTGGGPDNDRKNRRAPVAPEFGKPSGATGGPVPWTPSVAKDWSVK